VLDLLREQEIQARRQWFTMLETIQEVSDRAWGEVWCDVDDDVSAGGVDDLPDRGSGRVKASRALLGSGNSPARWPHRSHRDRVRRRRGRSGPSRSGHHHHRAQVAGRDAGRCGAFLATQARIMTPPR